MKRGVCAACGAVVRVEFAVPDEVWAEVVPEPYRGSKVCLACFTAWADEALVPWDQKIEFRPVSAHTLLFSFSGMERVLSDLGRKLAGSPNPHEWLRGLFKRLNHHQLARVASVAEEEMEADLEGGGAGE